MAEARPPGGAGPRPAGPAAMAPADAVWPAPANRTVFTGDNLDVLKGFGSDSVDLIYLDPPFGSNRDYAAPAGSESSGAVFKDAWSLADLDGSEMGALAAAEPALADLARVAKAVHGGPMMAYLVMMSVRLLELRRVLAPSGSIYLHCDPTSSHYLKVAMDSVFGRRSYRNEIVWKRSTVKGSRGKRRTLGSVTDSILFYSGGNIDIPATAPKKPPEFPHEDRRGRYRAVTGFFNSNSMNIRRSSFYEWNGIEPPHGWSVAPGTLDRLAAEDRIHYNSKGTPYRKQYESEYRGVAVGNLWDDIGIASGAERIGYPTQKPLALLTRIVQASSGEGDLVLDPFCGSGTALEAAERLGRRWIGIDLSPKAAEMVQRRLRDRHGLFGQVIHRTDLPRRRGAGARSD